MLRPDEFRSAERFADVVLKAAGRAQRARDEAKAHERQVLQESKALILAIYRVTA